MQVYVTPQSICFCGKVNELRESLERWSVTAISEPDNKLKLYELIALFYLKKANRTH